MVGFGMFRLISLLMECSCMAPLVTPVVMVMRGFVFCPLFCMVSISGSYLACSCVRACLGYPLQTICEFNELDCTCKRE